MKFIGIAYEVDDWPPHVTTDVVELLERLLPYMVNNVIVFSGDEVDDVVDSLLVVSSDA